jgi:hypothetical protein
MKSEKGDGHIKLSNFKIMECEKRVSYLFMAVPLSCKNAELNRSGKRGLNYADQVFP